MEETSETVVPQDGEAICTVCGFCAKCPRSLKIHYGRKHAKKNVSDDMDADAELTQKQQGDSDQSSSQNRKQTNKEEPILQERRVSKRTPKPKIIHSCNYCGQEFRDKEPLDIHIQRYHIKDVPYTFEVDDMEDEVGAEEVIAEESGDHIKASPTLETCKLSPDRFQLKCEHCDFKIGTPTSLENHSREAHPDHDWYCCKICNFFSATTQWMDTHLVSESHQKQQKEEISSEASLFDICVKKVSKDSVIFDAITEVVPIDTDQKTDETMDPKVLLVEEHDTEEPPRKKRGRPKLGASPTCEYCGLVVSNATNLSVHVRRKHSKEYGYSCTLCSYNCVTKGDMDRHCITKKHIRRAQESANKGDKSVLASEEPVSTEEQEEPEPMQTAATENVTKSTTDISGEEESQSSPKEINDDPVTACIYCDFVAQSLPSLHLHVKRKHTKEFEYVCLACSYYAVNSKEMSRHANTDKHKQKSLEYLEQQGNEEQKTLLVIEKDLNEADYDKQNPDFVPAEDSQSSSDRNTGAQNPNTEAVASSEVESNERLIETVVSNEDQSIVISQTSNSSKIKTEVTVSNTELSTEVQTLEDPVIEKNNEEQYENLEKDEIFNSDNLDVQLTGACFDASIVSYKALVEQEQFQEGEAAVICLTTGAPMSPLYQSAGGAFVKKLKTKETRQESGGRIRCEDCGFLADGMSGLNVHISMKHPTKEKHFHCLVCGKSFYTDSNLHQHLTSAAHLRNEQNSVEELPEGGASFKCVKCTERFENEQELFLHIKEKHEDLLREVNKYVLEDTEQINREREENKGNVCKYCGKVCKSSNSMAFLAHIRTHTGSKPFMCKICNFATAQLGDARNHVKRHLGMREYKCDICGWAFVMKKHLSTHMLGKHGVGQRKERKFECELCERSFSEKWALNNHMKLHNGEKPYKCAWPSCHYAFLTLSAMKDHFRTHTGEKSYLCDLCGFAGGTRHALTKHRRQHTGERPFKCKFCSFASTTQSHLSRHIRVHTGEKPYRCPWCDYRSNCAENIRKHILHTGKHEGVKMYNCPKCSFATNSPNEFRNHLKESHADIENPDLAYLHAGIVSKSFECRLKGQGAAFVEADLMGSPVRRKPSLDSGQDDPVQQVIIIQGYGEGEVSIDQALEESAAATLQTLAMAGQVAEVLHITEDGQVIASGREVASAGAHLAGGSTQYVVLESGEAREQLATGVSVRGQSHLVSESSTALDALLSAVTEMGQQEEMQGAVVHEMVGTVENGGPMEVEVKQEQEEVQVVEGTGQGGMQEVLQLAASQMMKEGLTQVIVNNDGTHYIVTELDDCTLQVEEGLYGEAGAEQQEQQEHKEMVVYVDGTPHNVVLEG
ncbi:zinc finger protein 407 isoform X1 [Boleophthalmus pectinirostris]|uniref:zinc finger protein 407 isoform X1 n=1 Tax=Boleophthalmus pectinirostris TaxID=150288 RepID=UPI000A1C5D42|nr:zinc finger protein 407 isoform X1 [Boleophthalmus pectinirostris]